MARGGISRRCLLAALLGLAPASGEEVRIGLNLRRSRGHAVAQVVAKQTPLVPLPNDTISADYWNMVNTAIDQAGRTTPRPPTLNDPAPTAAPLPWEQVMHASQPVNVVDSPTAVANLHNWEYGTPLPPDAMAAQATMHGQDHSEPKDRQMSVVPYDMQLGANIMYGISVHNTPTPPPTQEIVNQMFVAQCPMVMFSDRIDVRGPRCGIQQGQWVDPTTDREILRWMTDTGSLRFGVNSAVHGNGSITFASFKESFSVSSWFFELRNCLDVMRYNVEEQVIRVDHIAGHGHTTAVAHDQTHVGQAIFYKYIIRHPNGTTAAETAMFRMGQDMVNISAPPRDNEAVGMNIAVASRAGQWSRNQWSECTGTPRGWSLVFPASPHNMEAVATVQDLRVASAAVITLMAWRDEEAGSDGFQHIGQGALYYSLVRTVGLVFLVFILMSIVWVILTRKGIDKKLRRFFFRVEHWLLPRRAVKVREPILRPTY